MTQNQGQETQSQGPYPLAMVVCDAIWRDRSTGKATLLGLFSSIQAREFPAVHPAMAVYTAITDAQGKIKVRLRLVSANHRDQDDEVLLTPEMEREVECAAPWVIAEIDFHLVNVRFPHPGEYCFQLYAEETLLIERRMLVLQAQEPSQ